MTELYKKYRPTKPSEVIGQKPAMKVIGTFIKNGTLPQSLLFTGESGCGKTTVGRILRDKLGCVGFDYQEINASADRGIDKIREISQRMMLAPAQGKCRLWFIDEAHALTADAQNAFLKMLEDTPAHVRFILGTTDPQKLKKTIKTRCTVVNFTGITEPDLTALVESVAEKEMKPVTPAVARKIAEHSEKSARQALVLLHAVIDIDTEKGQIAAIVANDPKAEAFALAKMLIWGTPSWPKVCELLVRLEKAEPEKVRHLVLACCVTALLKPDARQNGRVITVLDEFRDNFYDSQRAGLVLACFNSAKG
jgi:DNA polymerase III gamma/tau subunit